jgi:hypothetical protein
VSWKTPLGRGHPLIDLEVVPATQQGETGYIYRVWERRREETCAKNESPFSGAWGFCSGWPLLLALANITIISLENKIEGSAQGLGKS